MATATHIISFGFLGPHIGSLVFYLAAARLQTLVPAASSSPLGLQAYLLGHPHVVAYLVLGRSSDTLPYLHDKFNQLYICSYTKGWAMHLPLFVCVVLPPRGLARVRSLSEPRYKPCLRGAWRWLFPHCPIFVLPASL